MNKMFAIVYRIYLSIARQIRQAYVCSRIDFITPPQVLGKVYINSNKIKVGRNVTFYPGVYLWGNEIEIGDNVDIGIGTIIYSRQKVVIGSNTSIAGQCYIIDSNHKTELGKLIREQQLDTASDGIVIGEDVWIAAQCTIIKGAKINDGAVIGAHSLVNCEVPQNAIAVGCPAKVIKLRE
jgi:acetyltransferase-like isoleucine patch superfamily enzyme